MIGNKRGVVFHLSQNSQSLRLIDEININKTISKLIWLESFRITLKQAFNIIGIDAPENM